MNLTSNTNYPYMGMRKTEDGVVPPQSVVVGEGSTPRQVEVLFVKWLMLLQLSTKSKTKCHTLITTKIFKQKET